jgi:molybdopterin synthase catalytic subunit
VIDIRVQSGDFEPGRQLERLEALNPGGIASLVVRAVCGEEVSAVTVEHYAAMAKPELTRIAEEAAARWPLAGIILIHRHGRFVPGDRLAFVGAAAAEPASALEACGFLADQLRRRGPFWRREILAAGGGRWIKGKAD